MAEDGLMDLRNLVVPVTAVDVSEGPARITKEFVPTAEVIVSDLFDLYTKLKGRTFDIVWCWGVIHHTGN